MLNPQQRKDLNLRDGVSVPMLDLLGRAVGLDLRRPFEYVEQHTEYRELHERLGPDETFQGFHFDGGKGADSTDMKAVVLVTNGINYPEPGYPEAYPFESVFDWE